MDDLNHIRAQVLTISIAVCAAVVRLVMDARQITLANVLRAVFVAAFVAYLTGEALAGIEISPGIKNAIVGVASLLSRELLEGLIQAGVKFKADPQGFINSIRRK